MQKKLTITIDVGVYDGLQRIIGKRKISQFIESLVRPHVIPRKLDSAYRELANDQKRESEALAWSESLVGDLTDESR